MEPTRPARSLAFVRYYLGLAGRLISRPFGVPVASEQNHVLKASPSRASPARGGCRWLEPAASAPISTKVACQGSVTLLLHEVFRPISKMPPRPSAGDLTFEVLGSAAEQLAETDPACRVSFSALFCLTRGVG